MQDTPPQPEPQESLPPLDTCPPSRPTRSMLARRIALWLGICSISAAPSLGITIQDRDYPLLPQILGILTFAIVAGVATAQPGIRKLANHPGLRRSLLIAYSIRTLVAAVPIAPVMIDLFVGIFAVSLGGALTYTFSAWITPFGNTYFLVLLQGVMLNIVVWALVLLIWMFQRLFLQPPTVRMNSSCPGCEYDLRGTVPGRPCPECGEMKLARCVVCDQDLATGHALAACPGCGSTRGYIDPRSRSWVDRVSVQNLTMIVIAAMGWAFLMAFVNQAMF